MAKELATLAPLQPMGQRAKASFADDPQSLTGRQPVQRQPLGPPGLQTFRDMQKLGQARPPRPMQPAHQTTVAPAPPSPYIKGGPTAPGNRYTVENGRLTGSAYADTSAHNRNQALPVTYDYSAERSANGYGDISQEQYDELSALGDEGMDNFASYIDENGQTRYRFHTGGGGRSETDLRDEGVYYLDAQGRYVDKNGNPVNVGTNQAGGIPGSRSPVGTSQAGGPMNPLGPTRTGTASTPFSPYDGNPAGGPRRPEMERMPGLTPPFGSSPFTEYDDMGDGFGDLGRGSDASLRLTGGPPPQERRVRDVFNPSSYPGATPPPPPTPGPYDPGRPWTPPGGGPGTPTAGDTGGDGFDPLGYMEDRLQNGSGDADIRRRIDELLNNPSGWDSDLIRQELRRGGEQIDDDFALRDQALVEEMAQRGLSDSSIRGGRMSDLNVARKSAETDLTERVMTRAADTRGNDVRSALAAAMGYEDQGFGNDMQMLMALLGFGQQGFENDMTVQEFMRRLQKDQDELALAGLG